jgi:hypothetical protein
LSCGGGSFLVIARVLVARIGGLLLVARNWGSNAAKLSAWNSVVCARIGHDASIWLGASTADAETTATTARRIIGIARSGDQFKIVRSKFSEVVTTQNMGGIVTGSDGEFSERDVTISSYTYCVESNVSSTEFVLCVGNGVIQILRADSDVATAARSRYGWVGSVVKNVSITVSNDNGEFWSEVTSRGQLVSTGTETARDASTTAATASVDVVRIAFSVVLIARRFAIQSVNGCLNVGGGDSLGKRQINPSERLEVDDGQVGFKRSIIELGSEILGETLFVEEFTLRDGGRTIQNEGNIKWFTAFTIRWLNEVVCGESGGSASG